MKGFEWGTDVSPEKLADGFHTLLLRDIRGREEGATPICRTPLTRNSWSSQSPASTKSWWSTTGPNGDRDVGRESFHDMRVQDFADRS